MKKMSGFYRLLTLLMGVVVFFPINIKAEEVGPWNAGFALSFPQPTGEMEGVLKNGFGVNFHVGHHRPDQWVGYRFDAFYNSFKLEPGVIERIPGASDGFARVIGGSPSVVLAPPVRKWLRPSLYFGPGLYYQNAETTSSDCEPYFGCPSGSGGTGAARLTTTRLGWQGGAGLDFLFDEGWGAISFNVQYVQVNNTNADMTFMPINFGYKVAF